MHVDCREMLSADKGLKKDNINKDVKHDAQNTQLKHCICINMEVVFSM